MPTAPRRYRPETAPQLRFSIQGFAWPDRVDVSLLALRGHERDEDGRAMISRLERESGARAVQAPLERIDPQVLQALGDGLLEHPELRYVLVRLVPTELDGLSLELLALAPDELLEQAKRRPDG